MKVLLLGHSFVTSLSDYLEHTIKMYNARDVRSVFKLQNTVSKIYMHGERGAKADGFKVPLHLLKTTNPDIIIIELGCNDLVAGAEIKYIVENLISLALKCKHEYGAQVVVLCGIIFREDLKGRNGDIKALNELIKAETQIHRSIIFHEHKHLKKLPSRKISRDGIHPNSVIGRKLYIGAISSAVHTAAKTYRRYSNSRTYKVSILINV